MKTAQQMAADIGRRIKNARSIACYSGEDLAFLMGFTPAKVASLECGQSTPSLVDAILLAEHCNTTVAYLAGEEEYGEPIRGFTGQIPFTTKGMSK